MPHYEYRCKKCSAHLMLQQEFHDDSVPNCPTCDALMSKIYAATPAIFRGTGWGKSK
jgi:putative FmdB family regulatory protein